MRIQKVVVARFVVALLGVASAVPAATIPTTEIQPLSSAIASRTAPTTVSAQFGDLLRRHAAEKLPIGTVEGLLIQVLKESIQQANRDTEAILTKLQRMNEVAEALRAQQSELAAKSRELAQLASTTDTSLTVAHGDRVVSAAEQMNLAAERLAEKLDSLKDLSASSQLELQQAMDRLQQLTKYLSQVTRALNDVIKSMLSNFKA